jgi:hypothetical protein
MAWLMENPEVVCTELEDGAILLNMESRFYYSLNTVALDIWRIIATAEGPEDLGRFLVARYDVDEEQARASVSRFVEQLERERLVIHPAGAGAEQAFMRSAGPDRGTEPTSKQTFAEPELLKHDEPLHEIAMSPFDPQLPLAE